MIDLFNQIKSNQIGRAMYKLSICIPTYNRAVHLQNCLSSIIKNKENTNIDFQVCISDNCSTDETESVVKLAQKSIEIKYQRNINNLGMSRNFLNVVEMADGEFVWMIGDDDLLMPNAIEELYKIIEGHPNVDFFYINAFHLTTEYIFSFPKPFNTIDLPKEMTPFSSNTQNGETDFMNLINPNISFDFLGGIFLSVFRRRNWENNVNALNENAIADLRTFSHFDNTFPHVKIFSKAFANSKAFINSKPLSVCLTGAREWSPMYPFIHSVRLVEALEEYRKNGLSFVRYVQCRNFALNNFIPDLISMFVYKKSSGYSYISPLRLVLRNCVYPNFYFSLIYFPFRKLKYFFKKLRSI